MIQYYRVSAAGSRRVPLTFGQRLENAGLAKRVEPKARKKD
jgi:hypothetical protein